MVTSQASAVVVLGSIAEHGFLRLARRRCLSIEVAREGSVEISTELNNGKWVADYALDCIQSTSNPEIPRLFKQQRMKYWLENGGRWYSVSGRVDGIERKWHVLPVYHPSVQNDPRFLFPAVSVDHSGSHADVRCLFMTRRIITRRCVEGHKRRWLVSRLADNC